MVRINRGTGKTSRIVSQTKMKKYKKREGGGKADNF